MLPVHPQRAAVLLWADDHDTQQETIEVFFDAELRLACRECRATVDAGDSLGADQLAPAMHAAPRVNDGLGVARS